jgi:hypothetical protein
MNLTYEDSIVGEIRPSVKEDCEAIAKNMRDQDKKEAWSAFRMTPIQIAEYSFNKSLISMTIIHESPIAMFGIMTHDLSIGVLWMLTTHGLESNGFGRPFVRNCKKWFNEMLEIYPVLIGTVDLRNTTSVRWLNYLGCEWGEQHLFGEDKMPFKGFCFRKKI